MINVLIVDDYAETMETLGMMYELSRQAYVAGKVSNAKEMWHVLATEKVDLLSLDIQLGAENGLDLCREVHEKYPSIFIVMCSVEAHEANQKAARLAGASHFLAKPLGIKELDAMLEWFRKRQEARKTYPRVQDLMERL